MSDPRYPIGEFQLPAQANPEEERRRLIEELAQLPERLRQALGGLNGKQLDTPYREGGWTVRQLTHHLADSHMNAYVRFKLALTEDEPTVKTYDEARWAELADSRITPIDVSLALVESLHARWAVLLRSLKAAEWARPLRHPEMGRLTVDALLSMYAWHGRHHLGHIRALRAHQSW